MNDAPPATLPPPPRRVHRPVLIGCGLWFLRLFILPHCIAGAVLILLCFALPVAWLLGSDVTGRVTGKGPGTDSDGDRTWNIQYAYAVDGDERTGEVSVSKSVYDATPIGREFPVRVLAGIPGWLDYPRVPGRGWWAVLFLPLLALFWNGVLSIFVWMAWVAPWRKWRLLRHGTEARGKITAKDNDKDSDGPTYKLRYQYRTPVPGEAYSVSPTLQTHEGQVTVTALQYNEAAAGGALTVLYDPRKPSRHLVYEYTNYSVEPDA